MHAQMPRTLRSLVSLVLSRSSAPEMFCTFFFRPFARPTAFRWVILEGGRASLPELVALACPKPKAAGPPKIEPMWVLLDEYISPSVFLLIQKTTIVASALASRRFGRKHFLVGRKGIALFNCSGDPAPFRLYVLQDGRFPLHSSPIFTHLVDERTRKYTLESADCSTTMTACSSAELICLFLLDAANTE